MTSRLTFLPFVFQIFGNAHERVQALVPSATTSGVAAELLHAVQVVENGGQHALFEIVQEVEQDAFARFENVGAQGDELFVGDAAVFETGRILRPAQRQERARRFPGLFDERLGRSILPERMQRVDLQRQEVQAHGVCRGQDGARQRMDVHQHTGFEADFEDRAPRAGFQIEGFASQRETRVVRIQYI
jgi:hypothetical protein